MDRKDFKALLVTEHEDGGFSREVTSRTLDSLPKGDMLIKVSYSSLNYKDALSANGNKGVTKQYPHTPGIDASGYVVESLDNRFSEGDEVLVTGYDFGMNTSGGFAEYVRVPSDWVIALPKGLTLKESMMLGTAGFTAGMSILKLAQSVKITDGPIAVSGATGGVGSFSVAILSKLGYEVTAISGKKEATSYLKSLGATNVLSRKEFGEVSKRPVLKGLFAGAVDTVGGSVLDNIIKSTKSLGVVTACGNAASPALDLSVFPFILRGVSLVGIDSQNCPMEFRKEVWNKLANEWKLDNLADVCKEQSLEELSDSIDVMMSSSLKGRVLVNINK